MGLDYGAPDPKVNQQIFPITRSQTRGLKTDRLAGCQAKPYIFP